MPLDHFVTLGNSGLRVSPFCLGTMTFGEDWQWGSSQQESHSIIGGFLSQRKMCRDQIEGELIPMAIEMGMGVKPWSPLKGGTLKQLDDNVAALDLKLTPDHIKRLNEISKPKLNFSHEFMANIAQFGMGGTTINGFTSAVHPLAPKSDSVRYEGVATKARA
jgi:aryl-alcohol dehydrogenase-like predicted oxidoreductase